MTFTPKKDPRIRRDKTCYVCKKPLTPIGLRELDPFCGAPCARKWHEAEIDRAKMIP